MPNRIFSNTTKKFKKHAKLWGTKAKFLEFGIKHANLASQRWLDIVFYYTILT